MSDHDIIPPVHMSSSDSLQSQNQSKQKGKKKKRQDSHPRTEPKALEDQDITTAPGSDHLIDYEA